MTRSVVFSGKFNEILDPERPCEWDDDGPKYFNLPPTLEAADAAERITRGLEAAHGKVSAAVKRAQMAPETVPSRYFPIPKG